MGDRPPHEMPVGCPSGFDMLEDTREIGARPGSMGRSLDMPGLFDHLVTKDLSIRKVLVILSMPGRDWRTRAQSEMLWMAPFGLLFQLFQ